VKLVGQFFAKDLFLAKDPYRIGALIIRDHGVVSREVALHAGALLGQGVRVGDAVADGGRAPDLVDWARRADERAAVDGTPATEGLGRPTPLPRRTREALTPTGSGQRRG